MAIDRIKKYEQMCLPRGPEQNVNYFNTYDISEEG